ncbi:MAG TPA: CAP domain-containing protein, partial [Isosphaeraceae bacterium]
KLVSTRYESEDTYTHFKLLATGDGSSNPVPPLAGGRNEGAERIKARLLTLSRETQAGSVFANTRVPVDLNTFRLSMLAIGNMGRRDPDYRKKHGETVATDLSGQTVLLPADPPNHPNGEEPRIFQHHQTPPYFDDLVLNDALNQAAQFQAEYQASTGKPGHDGPENYNGVNLTFFGDRARFFGYTFNLEGEGAGQGTPTDFPEGWMKSNTHYRPWFNVGADVREVGLGIARGEDESWYTCVVSGLGAP